MKIKLLEGYGINTDPNNYILVKEREAKDKTGSGKGVVEDNISYHATIESLMTSLVQRLLKERVDRGRIKTLERFLEEQKRLNDEIARLAGKKGEGPGAESMKKDETRVRAR